MPLIGRVKDERDAPVRSAPAWRATSAEPSVDASSMIRTRTSTPSWAQDAPNAIGQIAAVIVAGDEHVDTAHVALLSHARATWQQRRHAGVLNRGAAATPETAGGRR